jgi:hypothetical protein
MTDATGMIVCYHPRSGCQGCAPLVRAVSRATPGHPGARRYELIEPAERHVARTLEEGRKASMGTSTVRELRPVHRYPEQGSTPPTSLYGRSSVTSKTSMR